MHDRNFNMAINFSVGFDIKSITNETCMTDIQTKVYCKTILHKYTNTKIFL